MDIKKSSLWTNVALIGPAQYGKSTLAGFVVFSLNEVDSKTLNEAEQAALRRKDLSRKFAYLLDRKPDERAIFLGRGQTREPSWWGFERNGRRILLIDSPGQYKRVEHVVGTLSEADGVILVVDVKDYLESVEKPNVWRDDNGQVISNSIAQVHSFLSLVRFLGIAQVVVALHKMDLINFSQSTYEEAKLLLELEMEDLGFVSENVMYIPTAVIADNEKGFNITQPASELIGWYPGLTLVTAIEKITPRPQQNPGADLRMQINYVYQGRKVGVPGFELVITGKVIAGSVNILDEIVIQPSGLQCKVRTIQSIDQSSVINRRNRWESRNYAVAGEVIGLGCRIQSYSGEDRVSKGEMVGHPDKTGKISDRIIAKLKTLNIPNLYSLLSGQISGVFIMGHFRTGCQIMKYSFDGGQTWQSNVEKGSNKKETLAIQDFLHYEDDTILVELHLSRNGCLDVYCDGANLGLFVLLDPNLSIAYGGQIVEILS